MSISRIKAISIQVYAPHLHEIVSCFPRKPRKSPRISALLTTLADVRPANSRKFVTDKGTPTR